MLHFSSANDCNLKTKRYICSVCITQKECKNESSIYFKEQKSKGNFELPAVLRCNVVVLWERRLQV